MDSRERVFRTLAFEKPDRVPVDLWLSEGMRRKLGAAGWPEGESLLDAHDVDLRYIPGPRYIGPSLQTFSDGTDEDIWGVQRRIVKLDNDSFSETYKEVAQSPLTGANSVEEIDAYGHWPSPDWFDYGGIESQCDQIREKGRVVVFMGDRMNRLAQLKPAMYIRGVEQILMDMLINPNIAKAVFARIRDFYLAYAQRIFESANGKLDILLMGDDFGSQKAPLISNELWTEYLGDGFASFASLAKAHGLRVMHHTCGSVRPLLPLMIERGLDILQSLQPEAVDMEPEMLKQEFGGVLSFHGGISIQKTMPFGSPDDVRAAVRSCAQALAHGGGYIFCTAHNIQADTPVENVKALLEAYREFGQYS
jgi:uroporphyrinogen decarboxylase